MKENHISSSVIKRLPRYYRFLGELKKQGITRISSGELAKRMNLTASQIRQDLNCFGGFGQQGYGYNIEMLYDGIGEILGLNQPTSAIMLGVGKLGVVVAENMNFLKQVEQIGDQYLRIAMITGESPDVNRDYDLFEQIPDLENILTDVYESLTSLASDMKKSSGKRSGSIVAALNNMNRILKAMLDNPYDAHRYVKDYYSNYSSLGSWLYDMKSMPLSLDEIIFSSDDYDTKKDMANFFEKLGFGITKFFVSFSKEYGKSSDYNVDNKTIKIWVNWGRDQAQVLSNLIQTDFAKNTGINVQLEVVNASLAKGILSGDPPDLSLHLSRTEPVNLAMRDVLYDLTQFEDFESVMTS